MSYRQRVRLTTPLAVSGVCIELSDSQLLGARVSDHPDLTVNLVARRRNWLTVGFNRRLERNQTFVVELECLGSANGSGGATPAGVRWVSASEEALLAKGEASVAEVNALLDGLESPVDTEVRELGRLYFSRLDLATNPDMAPLAPELIGAIKRVYDTLKTRILLRAKIARTSVTTELPTHAKADVEFISGLMVGQLERTFGTPIEAPRQLESVGRTHDAFAWGGLQVPVTPGIRVPNASPDGAAVFMFPEFASLACEMQVSYTTWRELLPVLTRMPALYLYVHGLAAPNAGPRSFDDYCDPPEVEIPRGGIQAETRRLSQRFRRLSRADLGNELGELAAKAFIDSHEESAS